MAEVFTFENGKQVCFGLTIIANGTYVLYRDYELLDEERRAVRDQLDRAENQIDKLKEYIAKLEKTRGEWDDKAKNLKCELDKTYNQLMETEKDAQERIAELESELEVKDNLLKIKNGLLGNSDDLSTDPIEVAQMLINATYERETNAMERAFYKCGDTETVQRYSINDLEQIAEHLLVYCKHHREDVE